jgi:hypothetical protein
MNSIITIIEYYKVIITIRTKLETKINIYIYISNWLTIIIIII